MSDDEIFLAFTVLWIVPFIFLVIRMAQAQYRYLNLYRQAHPTIKLPEVRSDPIQFFSQINRTGNGINAYFEEQENPDLERSRREVMQRMRLTFSWGFGPPIVFFVIATIFSL